MAQALDYSFSQPGGAAIKSDGYQGVVRYVGAGSGKRLTRAEVVDLQAHRVEIACVVEGAANMATSGFASGVSFAQVADADVNSLGLPGVPLYFAVDFDANPSDVVDFFRGVNSVLGRDRTGVYGSYRITTDPTIQNLCKYRWQTVAWSGGKRDTGAHLFQNARQVQVNNVQCDINDILQADYGQHGAPAANPSNSTSEDDDMVTVPPGENEHIDIVVQGKSKLYIACSYGQKVEILAGDYFGDTGGSPDGTGVGGHFSGVIDPNRPGPIPVPGGAAMLTLRYNAAHSFGVHAV